jgi:hypothetical protein
MSMTPVATITIVTCQNMPVATMIYPLIAIVLFCSSVGDLFPYLAPSLSMLHLWLFWFHKSKGLTFNKPWVYIKDR